MTPNSSGLSEATGFGAPLQFIDAAHARFYDLGMAARLGVANAAAATALRDRMLPFMDLSDAMRGTNLVAGMGGRERAEFRRSGVVGVARFLAWAVEYANAVEEERGARLGEVACQSMYDPELLLDVMVMIAKREAKTRRG